MSLDNDVETNGVNVVDARSNIKCCANVFEHFAWLFMYHFIFTQWFSVNDRGADFIAIMIRVLYIGSS